MKTQHDHVDRLIRLYGSNPKTGTCPANDSVYWFEVIGNRSDLTDGELWQLINNGKRPTVKMEVAYPETEEEQAAMEWFNELEPDEILAQLKFRHQDWMNEQQHALAQAGAY